MNHIIRQYLNTFQAPHLNNRFLVESSRSLGSLPANINYNGLLYSFVPELQMFVNQYGHMISIAQAAAFAEMAELSEMTDIDDTSMDPGYSAIYVMPELIEVITDLAEITLNLADKNLLVPALQAESIKHGQLLYAPSGAGNPFGPPGTFGVNESLYNSFVQSVLAPYTSNTGYTAYYGTYPYHLVLDYEPTMTDFINGDKDPRLSTPEGISCALAINDLNTTLNLTKQLSPNSVVYEYSTPELPFFFLFTPGNACTWYTKSNAVTTEQWEAEKARLLEQHAYKVSLIANNTDHIDVNAYPIYSDGSTFAALNALANAAKTSNGIASARQVTAGKKPVQIFNAFSIFSGSEYVLDNLNLSSLQNLTSLVSNSNRMGFFIYRNAVRAGSKKMFIWIPAKYYSNVAALNTTNNWSADKNTYEIRKLLNNLFSDTNTILGSTTSPSFTYIYNRGLTADADWQVQTIRDAALTAARHKVIKLARLFKVWAGDYTPLIQDCNTVTNRLSEITKSLTAYAGGLTYAPYNWESIYNSTDPTTVSLLSQLTSSYNINLSTYGATSYTRSYVYSQIPAAYMDTRYKAGGSVFGCTNGNFTRDIGAIASTDTAVGNFVRSSGRNLATSYKIIQNRLQRGLSAGSSNSTTQTNALNKAIDILNEVSTHVPFQRSGWSNIVSCSSEFINDGNGYLASNWYIDGIAGMLSTLTSEVPNTTTNELKDAMRAEVYGLVENWTDRLPWYTRGTLFGLTAGVGQPNTNQWIEPATGLIQASLYLGDSNLLPAYNLGASLLAESLFYQNADGAFLEGWAYAMQSGEPMFKTVELMASSGDTRLQNPSILPFTVNSWYYMLDCIMPGNAILNAQDCRSSQYPTWSIGAPLPAIAAAAAGSSDSNALKNTKYLLPNPISTNYGIEFYEKTKGITAELTMSNFKFYNNHQLITWRTGRDRPIDVQGGSGSSHFALWTKGTTPKEGHVHSDQGHISIYCGKRIILMDCGVDYFTDNPALINPIEALANATGHNILQVDARLRASGYRPDCPITVNSLGTTGGNIVIDVKDGYINTSMATRQIIWNKPAGPVSSSPLEVTLLDSFAKTTSVTAGIELYRFHTGNTTGVTLSGSGNTWTVTWPGVTMSIRSNFGITLGQTGFNDFTQLLPNSDQSIGNPRVHRMVSVLAGSTINSGVTFSMTTGITVGWSQTEN